MQCGPLQLIGHRDQHPEVLDEPDYSYPGPWERRDLALIRLLSYSLANYRFLSGWKGKIR